MLCIELFEEALKCHEDNSKVRWLLNCKGSLQSGKEVWNKQFVAVAFN